MLLQVPRQPETSRPYEEANIIYFLQRKCPRLIKYAFVLITKKRYRNMPNRTSNHGNFLDTYRAFEPTVPRVNRAKQTGTIKRQNRFPSLFTKGNSSPTAMGQK